MDGWEEVPVLDGSTMAQDTTRDDLTADLPVPKLVLPRPCEGTTLMATARTVCDGAGRIECRQWEPRWRRG